MQNCGGQEYVRGNASECSVARQPGWFFVLRFVWVGWALLFIYNFHPPFQQQWSTLQKFMMNGPQNDKRHWEMRKNTN